MHFELLGEDQSGKQFLDIIVPDIIRDADTFRTIAYKGIGKIPKHLAQGTNVTKRILLEQLPRLVTGYGKAFAKYPSNYQAAVIVICDLDDKCLASFRNSLIAILDECEIKPKTRFCLAVEEGEAWLLGDLPAVKKAYPKAKDSVLNAYENDSICGTWECLADAVYAGGHTELSKKGWHAVGKEKSIWAEKIAREMDASKNKSPSFRYFEIALEPSLELLS